MSDCSCGCDNHSWRSKDGFFYTAGCEVHDPDFQAKPYRVESAPGTFGPLTIKSLSFTRDPPLDPDYAALPVPPGWREVAVRVPLHEEMVIGNPAGVLFQWDDPNGYSRGEGAIRRIIVPAETVEDSVRQAMEQHGQSVFASNPIVAAMQPEQPRPFAVGDLVLVSGSYATVIGGSESGYYGVKFESNGGVSAWRPAQLTLVRAVEDIKAEAGEGDVRAMEQIVPVHGSAHDAPSPAEAACSCPPGRKASDCYEHGWREGTRIYNKPHADPDGPRELRIYPTNEPETMIDEGLAALRLTRPPVATLYKREPGPAPRWRGNTL